MLARGPSACIPGDGEVASFEPVYTGIADIAAGLLEVVGQSELASRVKPTVRRKAGLDAPAPEPAKEAQAPAPEAPAVT